MATWWQHSHTHTHTLAQVDVKNKLEQLKHTLYAKSKGIEELKQQLRLCRLQTTGFETEELVPLPTEMTAEEVADVDVAQLAQRIAGIEGGARGAVAGRDCVVLVFFTLG